MIFVLLGVEFNEDSVGSTIRYSGNKKIAISQLVKVLKKVQAIQSDNPFSLLAVHNSSMQGKHMDIGSEIEKINLNDPSYINDFYMIDVPVVKDDIPLLQNL